MSIVASLAENRRPLTSKAPGPEFTKIDVKRSMRRPTTFWICQSRSDSIWRFGRLSPSDGRGRLRSGHQPCRDGHKHAQDECRSSVDRASHRIISYSARAGVGLTAHSAARINATPYRLAGLGLHSILRRNELCRLRWRQSPSRSSPAPAPRTRRPGSRATPPRHGVAHRATRAA